MFGFRKRKPAQTATAPAAISREDKHQEGLFSRLKTRLSRTRDGLANLVAGRRTIDADLLEELETLLASNE